MKLTFLDTCAGTEPLPGRHHSSMASSMPAVCTGSMPANTAATPVICRASTCSAHAPSSSRTLTWITSAGPVADARPHGR